MQNVEEYIRDASAGKIRKDGMFLFSFRLKLTKSASSSLICLCCVSCDLGENHMGPGAETEVGTYNTSGLKYKASEQRVMGSKLAQ